MPRETQYGGTPAIQADVISGQPFELVLQVTAPDLVDGDEYLLQSDTANLCDPFDDDVVVVNNGAAAAGTFDVTFVCSPGFQTTGHHTLRIMHRPVGVATMAAPVEIASFVVTIQAALAPPPPTPPVPPTPPPTTPAADSATLAQAAAGQAQAAAGQAQAAAAMAAATPAPAAGAAPPAPGSLAAGLATPPTGMPGWAMAVFGIIALLIGVVILMFFLSPNSPLDTAASMEKYSSERKAKHDKPDVPAANAGEGGVAISGNNNQVVNPACTANCSATGVKPPKAPTASGGSKTPPSPTPPAKKGTK